MHQLFSIVETNNKKPSHHYGKAALWDPIFVPCFITMIFQPHLYNFSSLAFYFSVPHLCFHSSSTVCIIFMPQSVSQFLTSASLQSNTEVANPLLLLVHTVSIREQSQESNFSLKHHYYCMRFFIPSFLKYRKCGAALELATVEAP